MPISNGSGSWLTPLGAAHAKTLKASNQLSSGRRLQSAADNAAGMAISIGLEAEIKGLHQAGRNTVQALSVLRTAEGGMASTAESLIRMQELAVMAGSSTYTDSQRQMIQAEVDGLQESINQVAGTTEFNGQNLLDGSAGTLDFQVGTGPSAANQISFDTPNLTAASLGVDGASVLTAGDAQSLLGSVEDALSQLSEVRADVGSAMNNLDTAGTGIQSSIENTVAAQSAIRDTDVASASTDKASGLIQLNVAVAMAVQGQSLHQGMVSKLLM